MAPNKFENYIKKSLDEREITPSENAWERISEQLESSSEKKSQRYSAYFIAASIVGLLLISIGYFTGAESLAPMQQATQKPSEKAAEQENVLEYIPEKESSEIQIVDQVEVHKKEPIVKTEISESVKSTRANDQSTFAVDEMPKVLVDHGATEGIMETKIAEIVAQVDFLERTNGSVTNAEIDTLLRMAQKEVLKNKVFQRGNTVDAMALLVDVEDELDQSFRDHIFEALKEGYTKVRTAVADRNQ
jgi:hypothetical protein